LENKGTTPDGLGKCNVMQMPSMKHLTGRIPLDFVNGKRYKKAFADNKNRSGQLDEHMAALADDAALAGDNEKD
jgi:hypothetical protein